MLSQASNQEAVAAWSLSVIRVHIFACLTEREPVVIGRFATVLVGKRLVAGHVRQVVSLYR
jgi:hypothetical protein